MIFDLMSYFVLTLDFISDISMKLSLKYEIYFYLLTEFLV